MPEKSWLDTLTHSTRNLEPPERFFYWAGLAVIASIVKKNVLLDRFSYILYPNIYVVLVSAKSGLRKGIPISYARGILRSLDCTRVIEGQNSVPQMIDELSSQTTTPTGKVYSDAQALLCAPELDSFIIKDELALTTLTDLHNTHEHEHGWKKSLKSGVAELKNPCISLLGASNETLFEDFISAKDIEGGFIARTFIIHESKRRINNSLMFKPEGLIPKVDLAEPLKRLVNLTGVFTIEEKVKHLYDEWYNNISENMIEDRTGAVERIGDQVLKVAMLISLSKSNSLIIDEDDFLVSAKKCEEALIGTKKISMGQGKSEVSPIMSQIIKILVESPGQETTRSKLLQRINCETIQLDRAIDTLLSREAIEDPYRKRGDKSIYYRMRKEVFDQYLKIRSQ